MVVSRGAEGKELGICLSSAPLLPFSSADLHPAILGWRTTSAAWQK
ncbi:hypothetical protein IQ277_15160 [Nostocales cyanobacterium LEGE 12452]|nr:hypothetical protein [Nostocales cyanobacterium LEGE 12452]